MFWQKKSHIYSKTYYFFHKTLLKVGGTGLQGASSNFNLKISYHFAPDKSAMLDSQLSTEVKYMALYGLSFAPRFLLPKEQTFTTSLKRPDLIFNFGY